MKTLLMSLLTLSALVSCNGGGNGGGSPATTTGNGTVAPALSHNELAQVFVQELNLDVDFDVDLVKDSTLQTDFIVIYDPFLDSYDAIDIQTYNPAIDNAADFYFDNSALNYFDLGIIPAGYEIDIEYVIVGYDDIGDAVYGYEEVETYVPTRYEHFETGVIFEKVQASSKDLAKMVALKEVAQIQKSATFLSSEFGLSLERGKELAKLQAHFKKVSKKGMTNAEVDLFSTELLGFSLSDGVSAYNASQSGDSSSLTNLLDQSAAVNGITPEHATKLMTKVFGL